MRVAWTLNTHAQRHIDVNVDLASTCLWHVHFWHLDLFRALHVEGRI